MVHITILQSPSKKVNLQDSLDKVFSGSISKPGFLELCAGSAILSFTAENAGFFAIPVDYSMNKFQPKISTVRLDLADDACVDICCDAIQSGVIQVVTAAIPCGTASRARHLPNGPPPLRSLDHPYGLPSLTGLNKIRVEKANKIYSNAGKILSFADSFECIALAENPDRAYTWILDEFLHLLELGFVDTVFQHCKWTKSRPMRAKWTRMRVNKRLFLSLAGECTQSHEHLPWGRTAAGFDTAGEAAYPPEMCDEIVKICVKLLVEKGFKFFPKAYNLQLEDETDFKRRRATAAKQPRGNKLPPLMPEFKEIKQISLAEATSLEAKVLRPHLATWAMKGVKCRQTKSWTYLRTSLKN